MKMVKKTLIALALVALVATSVQAAQGSIEEWYFEDGDHAGVKVDGKDQPTFRWPYSVSYKELDICTIPIYMEVGMYVQIHECGKKKIVLEQVDCGVIGQAAKKYPCYKDCIDLTVRSNFEVKLGTKLNKNDSGLIKDWKAYFDNTDVVPGDGADHNVKLCVEAWEAQLFKHEAGDEVAVGSVTITVKPN
jgi:hypothetical protein